MGESSAIARADQPASGHARYIGRVGGLAFALGVGAAVLAGAGAASADTSDSPAAGSGSTSQSSTASTSPTSTASSKDAGPKRPTRKQRAAAKSSSESESDTDAAATDPGSAADPSATAADSDVATDPVGTRTHRKWASRTHKTEAAASTQSVSATTAAAAASPSDAFLNNQSPTLAYNPTENQTVGDHIEGNLHPNDPDSAKLTYTATRPAHGTVKIDSEGGFVYTPNSSFAGQDSFDVTVSDARSGFHIHGREGLLSLLSFGILGNSGHKTTETVFLGLSRAVVASGLNSPVDFRFLTEDRILVAEKGGAIKLVENGVVAAQPVITLSVNTSGERGISGLAVDPNFATNGYIYVAYTTSAIKDRLSRFTVVGNAAGSELVLFETPDQVAQFHHGGALDFGPDGKLYWGKGDNTVGANAQDLTNIFGKILRLNPDGSIPSDNPVINGSRTLIYAYGLRNPFRLNFTPDGKLLVADVGNAAFEELNLVTAGGNYGWPGSEGICTSSCAGQINPIYTYAHGAGAAITSVLYYDGGALGSGFQDKVFIADTVQGFIRVLTCTPQFTSCGNPQTFDPDAGATVVLAQGPDGALYQLLYQPGTLVRISGGDSSAALAV